MQAAFLHATALASGLRPFSLAGKQLLPIVQGGMGVGISASKLAGTVASMGGVGTISSVDLRRHHPDLMAATDHLKGKHAKEAIDAANLDGLSREFAKARAISQGRGLIAINVMRAVSEYEHYVRRSLECGIDAVVVGAGLPLDLPEIAKDYPKAALVPILSDARGVQLIVRKWEKKGRLPDAIVIEHPKLAGGHLGAAKIEDLNDKRFDFDVVLPEVLEFFRKTGLEGKIPLIPAGGISSLEDIRKLQSLGAAAVQLGTAFAVTQEGDASIEFKHVLADAKPEDRGVHERCRPAGTRRAHALARQVFTRVPQAVVGGFCEEPLQHVVRLPGPVRIARRQGGMGPVLHRPAARPCRRWGRAKRAILQGSGPPAIRQ